MGLCRHRRAPRSELAACHGVEAGTTVGKQRFENFSFGYNAQPSYNFGSTLVARMWLAYMALTPRWLAQSLFVFQRKRAEQP